MKHFVKRGIADSYESSRLELEDVWEWTYLRVGISNLISQADKRIKYLNDAIKNFDSFSDAIKNLHGSVDKLKIELDEELGRKKFFEKMYSDLEVENEIKI